ncbi:hypothetical protein B8V81_5088 [Paenibacillus pasadenensis]|uniref:Uncharacterized protein n=2 Tax=Paenibacillus pasadenensis TaxID=217090 RepID=A0A2N5MZP2_9BACL|nr:hypothetical protein B8V81_5088 [Paenibacillus pasadenensis]
MTERRKNLSIDGDDEQKKRQYNNLDVVVRPLGGAEERFYIGDMAIEAGEDETVVGTEKADNPYIHIPLLAMLALHTPRREKEAHFSVVCGLPIKQFNETARAKMKDRLLSEFDVTFMDAQSQPGRKVRIIIDDVVVVPEGVPVIFNRMLNETADDIARPELRQGSWGVIDIGAFTTDCPVIVNGKPDSMASDGIDEGIATYIDRIASSLSNSTRATITRNQILHKILNNDLELVIRGKIYPLQKEIEDQLFSFARKIIDVIDRMWSKNYEIREFFVVGGGGKMLKPFLARIMADRDIALTFIEMKNSRDDQNDPQLQNAYGYWKMAKQRFGA